MTLPKLTKKLVTSAAAAAVLAGGSLVAGDYGKAIIDDKAPIEADPWTICDVFDYSTLYEGDGFIKKVKFVGRYHGQYHSVSSSSTPASGLNNGSHYWDSRRWRSGVQVDFANDLTFKNTYNLDTGQFMNGYQGNAADVNSGARFVDSVEEAYIKWSPSDDFYVIVGRQKPKITREYTTSSTKILTFERSNIVNEVTSDKTWGTTVGFKTAGFSHEVGIFATGAENGWRWHAPDAGMAFNYRTSTSLTESTDIFLDYQYTDVSNKPNFTNDFNRGSDYEHVLAIGTESEWGRLGLITDLIWGFDGDENHNGIRNMGDGDVFGIVIMPTYDITDKLQFVAKYSYITSNAQDGFDLHRPHNRTAVDPDLASLHTFYAGLNYRICGDKLKLMGGYEYATGDQSILDGSRSYKSDAWLVGVRTYW